MSTENGVVSFTDYVQTENLAKRLGIKRNPLHRIDIAGRVHRFGVQVSETRCRYFRFAYLAETLSAIDVYDAVLEDGAWVPDSNWMEEPTMATVVALFLEATE